MMVLEGQIGQSLHEMVVGLAVRSVLYAVTKTGRAYG